MHVLIDRNRMVHDVQHVSKAVSPRTTIPILTGIKIVATKNGLTLTGSDSDLSIEAFIPTVENEKELVEVQEEGSIVLQSKYFSEIVKKLPGDTIDITVHDQFAATIRSGSSVFTLNGLDPDEYPRLPQLKEDLIFSMPQDMLRNVIRQTVFAVSTQETRPVLTGVNIETEEGGLICTATDSHRLAMRRTKIDAENEDLHFQNVVIPGKSLQELSKIVEDTSDAVNIVVTENQILFKLGHVLFFSRLLEGKYPVTSSMIPNQSRTSFVLKTKPLLQTLERALLLSREAKNNVINMKTLGEGEIEISSTSQEVGKVTEQMEVERYEGEELRISFNGKNIIDALKVIDSEEIHLMFTGAMSPFVIRPIDSDRYLHLFSPVRTY
ncbi:MULTISPECIES: DNA polymerase III subunit beta [Shouchella]|uniref:Beta sliding clamp n=2 Tax=Shouchella TaxID=2893057 RepID=A0ABY7WBU5_9BACI|nr:MULTISPECIES: DNA polymerase III subunit beta [Shouchella]MED4129869.1 DNA polymerase III subunit beta [Shouchella miscanthi]WDF05320.1 DNA polymerase III subunit beta [Shouchella hunanensis]